MKLKVLEPVTDRFGSKKGFGDKLIIGEIFEVADNARALELIASGCLEEVKELVKEKVAEVTA